MPAKPWRQSKQAYKSKRRHKAHNPYFQNKTEHSFRLPVRGAVSVIALLTIVGWVIWFPGYRIRGVVVEGLDEQTHDQVSTFIDAYLDKPFLLLLPRNHTWFFSEKQLNAQLLEAFSLSTAEVIVQNKALRVLAEARVSTFYLQRGDQLFSMDRSGTILKEVDDLTRIRLELDRQQGTVLPYIVDERDKNSELSAEMLTKLVLIHDQINSRTMLTTNALVLTSEQGRVHVQTTNGIEIYLNTDREIESQIKKLETLIDRKLANLEELTYIDLRFKDRLYYH